MDITDNGQLNALREMFQQKCFDIVEEGVEGRKFRMKDVAKCLGISSQVASKLVNPTNPRILTAFELFRMSILIRRPVTDIIPMDLYLTAGELEDTELCGALCTPVTGAPETSFLIEAYRQLPEDGRQSILMLVRTMREMAGKT